MGHDSVPYVYVYIFLFSLYMYIHIAPIGIYTYIYIVCIVYGVEDLSASTKTLQISKKWGTLLVPRDAEAEADSGTAHVVHLACFEDSW